MLKTAISKIVKVTHLSLILLRNFRLCLKLSNFQNHIILDEDEIISVPLMIADVEIRGWGGGGMINPTSDSVSFEILNNENWITYNQSNSTLIFTPSNNEVGEHDFTLKLTDKDGAQLLPKRTYPSPSTM